MPIRKARKIRDNRLKDIMGQVRGGRKKPAAKKKAAKKRY